MSKRKQKQKRPAPKSVPTPAPADLKGMLALSCRQPWAEFIVTGEKTIEYRSQPLALRGRVLIYASLGRRSAEWEEQVADEWDFDLADLDTMPRGVIVGSVEIVNCEEALGEYEWQLANPLRFQEPIKPQHRANPVWFRPFGWPRRAPNQLRDGPGGPSSRVYGAWAS